jgi:hypothetical protein
LMSKGVTVLICPDCMKQYGIKAAVCQRCKRLRRSRRWRRCRGYRPPRPCRRMGLRLHSQTRLAGAVRWH